jgi:hypothetical protein
MEMDRVESTARRLRDMAEYHARLDESERPLVRALRDAGYEVESSWDFVNAPTPPDAVPLLLEHLRRPYLYRIKEGIARSLMFKPARPEVMPALVEEFLALPGDSPPPDRIDDEVTGRLGYKVLLGQAIGFLATKDDLDLLSALVRDRRHGEARFGLIRAIVTKNRKQAGDVLMEILEQKDVEGMAINGLGILRDPRARSYVNPLAQGRRPPWGPARDLYDAANKYLKRIGEIGPAPHRH